MFPDEAIFLPVLVQASLMMGVAFWMAWARVGSVARGKVDFRDVRKTGWQGWIKNAGDNYSNQYEAPVLFMLLCIVLFVVNGVTPTAVIMAWVFVGLRVVHAAIHLTYNHILHRFFAFFLSMLALTALLVLTFKAVI